MTIYVDDGKTVKIYPVKVKVAKAVYKYCPQCGVKIVEPQESEEA